MRENVSTIFMGALNSPPNCPFCLLSNYVSIDLTYYDICVSILQIFFTFYNKAQLSSILYHQLHELHTQLNFKVRLVLILLHTDLSRNMFSFIKTLVKHFIQTFDEVNRKKTQFDTTL